MKKSNLLILIASAMFLLSFQYLLIQNYLDFVCNGNPYILPKQAGNIPMIFCPKIISTKDHQEYGIHFSEDGKELYFTRKSKEHPVILYSEHTFYGWTQPRVLEFMEDFPGTMPCTSYGGTSLIYLQTPHETDPLSNEIVIAEKEWWGWETPQILTDTDMGKYKNSFSLARNGNLYLCGDPDDSGQMDIYISEYRNGQYMPPRNLGPDINTEYEEGHVFIAPDESYILFDSDRPSSLGGKDLYISYRNTNGTWTQARNLGGSINTKDADWMPYISPDGKYLFFSRSKGNNVDIYWVSADVIDNFKGLRATRLNLPNG